MDVSSKDFQRKPGEYIEAAVSGESVVIIRHSRPAVVIIQHEQWRQMTFDDPRWRSVLNRMAGKWPTPRSDHELITDLLQRWEIDQDAGNSKGVKLDKIYNLLLWVAKNLGYKGAERIADPVEYAKRQEELRRIYEEMMDS